MVLSIPLAAPASERSTVARTKSVFGAMNIPLPRPPISSGSTSAHDEGSLPLRDRMMTTAARPAVKRLIPRIRTLRPNRWDSLSLFEAVTRLPSANGVIVRPAARALCPRPRCQSNEKVKKTLVNAAK